MILLSKLPTRDEIEEKYKWRLEDIYVNDDQWEEDLVKLKKKVKILESYVGSVAKTSEDLFNVLTKKDEISHIAHKLYAYAKMRLDEDNTNSKYQALAEKATTLLVEIGGKLAFIEPEILSLSREKVESFLKENKRLRLYAHYLEDLFRMKDYVLDADKERMLAEMGEISQAPERIFSMLDNADLKFPNILDENGNEIELTKGRYNSFMESSDRNVRKAAFEGLHGMYKNFINTLSTTLASNVKKNIYYKNQRGFKTSLEASLFSENIPRVVYDNLIDTVSSRLDLMYRYVALRKDVLNLDELHMYDLYVPLVKDFDKKVSYEEAKKIVTEGLSVLGSDYINTMNKGFNSGWVDVCENRGKTGGAYSWGTYGVHPYVLLNFQGKLSDVFTIAHEMGHAMHTYYSMKNQPFPYHQYTIFVAEVASTCNEALLIKYLLENTKDKKEKMFLLNHFMEQFKGTVYRQTMFAEFEKKIHEKAEQGQPLNAKIMCDIYHKLNEKYFGSNIYIDSLIDYEWARIPHFYSSFYVYKYATGFSAAIAISKNILDQGQAAVAKYIDFLSKGSSDYPIELLKNIDVDLTTSKPIKNALDVFEKLLDEFELLL